MPGAPEATRRRSSMAAVAAGFGGDSSGSAQRPRGMRSGASGNKLGSGAPSGRSRRPASSRRRRIGGRRSVQSAAGSGRKSVLRTERPAGRRMSGRGSGRRHGIERRRRIGGSRRSSKRGQSSRRRSGRRRRSRPRGRPGSSSVPSWTRPAAWIRRLCRSSACSTTPNSWRRSDARWRRPRRVEAWMGPRRRPRGRPSTGSSRPGGRNSWQRSRPRPRLRSGRPPL
mmetsp:Transcript_114497/g.324329  ORF Transcript_114497/g.324329 Transcript_114497/m.324329 type:complete len:226 (-) Transcript_114497:1099-1776(-)